MHALTAFLEPESTEPTNDDWGQFATLETPPQPQYKARVKPVLPRIEEEREPMWAVLIEKFLDWMS